MKNRKIWICLLGSIILLFILIFSLLRLYDFFIYDSLNKMVYSLEEVYPDVEIDVIQTLMDEKEVPKVLDKYGINPDTIHELGNYQSFRNEIILIVVFAIFLLLSPQIP